MHNCVGFFFHKEYLNIIFDNKMVILFFYFVFIWSLSLHGGFNFILECNRGW